MKEKSDKISNLNELIETQRELNKIKKGRLNNILDYSIDSNEAYTESDFSNISLMAESLKDIELNNLVDNKESNINSDETEESISPNDQSNSLDLIRELLMDEIIWRSVRSAYRKLKTSVKRLGRYVPDKLKTNFKRITDPIKNTYKSIKDSVKNQIKKVTDPIKNTYKSIKNSVSNQIKKVTNPIKKSITKWSNKLTDYIGRNSKSALSKLSEYGSKYGTKFVEKYALKNVGKHTLKYASKLLRFSPAIGWAMLAMDAVEKVFNSKPTLITSADNFFDNLDSRSIDEIASHFNKISDNDLSKGNESIILKYNQKYGRKSPFNLMSHFYHLGDMQYIDSDGVPRIPGEVILNSIRYQVQLLNQLKYYDTHGEFHYKSIGGGSLGELPILKVLKSTYKKHGIILKENPNEKDFYEFPLIAEVDEPTYNSGTLNIESYLNRFYAKDLDIYPNFKYTDKSWGYIKRRVERFNEDGSRLGRNLGLWDVGESKSDYVTKGYRFGGYVIPKLNSIKSEVESKKTNLIGLNSTKLHSMTSSIGKLIIESKLSKLSILSIKRIKNSNPAIKITQNLLIPTENLILNSISNISKWISRGIAKLQNIIDRLIEENLSTYNRIIKRFNKLFKPKSSQVSRRKSKFTENLSNLFNIKIGNLKLPYELLAYYSQNKNQTRSWNLSKSQLDRAVNLIKSLVSQGVGDLTALAIAAAAADEGGLATPLKPEPTELRTKGWTYAGEGLIGFTGWGLKSKLIVDSGVPLTSNPTEYAKSSSRHIVDLGLMDQAKLLKSFMKFNNPLIRKGLESNSIDSFYAAYVMKAGPGRAGKTLKDKMLSNVTAYKKTHSKMGYRVTDTFANQIKFALQIASHAVGTNFNSNLDEKTEKKTVTKSRKSESKVKPKSSISIINTKLKTTLNSINRPSENGSEEIPSKINEVTKINVSKQKSNKLNVIYNIPNNDNEENIINNIFID